MPLATFRFEDKFNMKCPYCKAEKRIVYELRNYGSILIYCQNCKNELLFISEIETLLIPLLNEKFGDTKKD